MAQTSAIFRDWGKTPSLRDLLTMIDIGLERYCENSLSRFVGMLKGPDAFPVANVEMI